MNKDFSNDDINDCKEIYLVEDIINRVCTEICVNEKFPRLR